MERRERGSETHGVRELPNMNMRLVGLERGKDTSKDNRYVAEKKRWFPRKLTRIIRGRD